MTTATHFDSVRLSSKKNKRSTREAQTHLAVVGLGYVGLPLALLAETKGFLVRGFDIDHTKIARLRTRNAAFLSPHEQKVLQKSKIEFFSEEEMLDGASTFIICVPTPVDTDHRPDLAPLIGASEVVGRHLKKGSTVIVESTVNPGVCERVALRILTRESGLEVEKDFFFAHCPERINPGDTHWDVRNIPRVLGAAGPKSLKYALVLYRSITDAKIVPMGSIKEAEAVKMVENSFRDINIAFVNELAMSFAKAGIDITNVIRGASSKPFAFMPHFPGCGVGGHCIPVDPYYLIRYGRENGFEHRFLATAREINNGMPKYTVELVQRALMAEGKPISGATIALLGLSYKKDVPDIRESPALAIQEELAFRGASIQIFDPFIKDRSTCASLAEALAGADAAIVATDHTVFRELSPQTFLTQKVPIVIDGRNCLSKEKFLRAGLVYQGIGR